MTPKMEVFDSKKQTISFNNQKEVKQNFSLKKDLILCTHCKRTASNGIRCLGMCVADNDY